MVDADCPSAACDFETGSCVDAASVLYASPTGTEQAECSQQAPCSATKAVAAANVARSTVKLLPGVYSTNLRIDRAIALHGEGATIIATATAAAPALLVVDAARARVYDLSIVNNNTTGSSDAVIGVLCQSEDNLNTPQLALTRVSIDAKSKPMHLNLCKLTASQTTLRSSRTSTERYLLLVANGGSASFDRSTFIGGGSLAVLDAHITITNSVIDGLLGDATEGALVAALGSISIAYSTIFDSPLPCGTGTAPACASAAREGICIENSIVNKPSSLNDAIGGNKCRCDYCVVSPQQGTVLGANNLIGANPNFKNPAGSDFRLLADSPAIDAAHPSITGTADYDGVARPQNGRSDMGAFEFKP